jgi:hypothetical protein
VNHLRDRSPEAEVGTVAIYAGVIGEALRVHSDAELIVVEWKSQPRGRGPLRDRAQSRRESRH